jgi:hypothetical protein
MLCCAQVLASQPNIQADLDALEAAQEACVAAARVCAKQQPSNGSSSSSSTSAAAAAPGMVQLRHQLDKAFLAACKASEWREMTAVGLRADKDSLGPRFVLIGVCCQLHQGSPFQAGFIRTLRQGSCAL